MFLNENTYEEEDFEAADEDTTAAGGDNGSSGGWHTCAELDSPFELIAGEFRFQLQTHDLDEVLEDLWGTVQGPTEAVEGVGSIWRSSYAYFEELLQDH